jgi:photosystem II stability/assembly factor-like uncharacterized protein
LTLIISTLLTGEDCIQWKWVNPVPHSNNFNDVIYDGTLFRAVCDNGMIMTSEDGQTWETMALDINDRLMSIARSSSKMVVVGDHGVSYYSSNGDTWAPGGNLNGKNMRGITYGNNLFVAVGEGGAVFSSADGITWSSHATGAITYLYDVLYDGSQFMTVGTNGALCTSPNGLNWTVTQCISGFTEDLYNIEFHGDNYLITGESGTVLLSSNGDNWIDRSVSTGVGLYDSFFYNELYHVFGSTQYASADGTNWDTISYFGNPIYEVTQGDNLFSAVGYGGGFSTSIDLESWTTTPQLTRKAINCAVYGDGKFVAIATNRSMVSINGTEWTLSENILPSPIKDIEYFNNMFIAAGYSGRVYYSLDGLSWLEGTSPTNQILFSLSHDGSHIIAVGASGTILKSSDGITWTHAELEAGLEVTDSLYGVCFGRSGLLFRRFIAVGSDGCILYSMNGTTWSAATDSGLTNRTLNSVASMENTFVACGSNGALYKSTGGQTWEENILGIIDSMMHISNEGLVFRIVGVNGNMLTSEDGQTWEDRHLHLSSTLHDSVTNGDTLILFGTNGTILKHREIEEYLNLPAWPIPDSVLEFIETLNGVCLN